MLWFVLIMFSERGLSTDNCCSAALYWATDIVSFFAGGSPETLMDISCL